MSEVQFNGRYVHYECAFRSIMGSVAHIQRRCSCFVAGSEAEDPPGMTRRQAALAAVIAWNNRNQRV